MQISFDEFCTVEMMSLADRQAFKAWLGDRANVRRSHAEWWKLFGEWVNER